MVKRLTTSERMAKLARPRTVAVIGGALALLALLANDPGVAIVIASLIVPAAMLVELPKRDLLENEPRWGAPAMLAWGLLVGVLVSAINAALVAELWIDGAALHVGAAGFGGAAAEREGGAPIVLLLLGGIVMPAVAIALTVAGPVGLRRYPIFRNEVMDGVTLGGAAGGGFATGSTLVFVWPMVAAGRSGGGSAADWTATLIGLFLTRPLIFAIAAALVCVGLWRVAITQHSPDLVVPAACGVGGVIVFALGDLVAQPQGARVELLWHLVAVVGLIFVARPFAAGALAQDRRLVASSRARIICPSCRSMTPPGQFCAVCGRPLAATPAEAAADTNFAATPEAPPDPVVDVSPAEPMPGGADIDRNQG